LIIALFLLGFVTVLSLLNLQQLNSYNERHVAAFRMGASIYVGTFLLGNNFDYRLAFLIFVVPQLIEWVRSPNKTYRLVAGMSMILVLLSCWHLWIIEIPMEFIFHSVQDSRKFWIILDETLNWTLLMSLAYLLFASTPGWLKAPLTNLVHQRIYDPNPTS
jgi:hypothetical protein